MDDKALKTRVVEELDWDRSLNAALIGVTVQNGIVHLSGHVASYPQQLAAEAAVKRVRGVRGFVDGLEVRLYKHTASDDAIAERAANLLAWDAGVPKDAIQVKVADGLITLLGEVDLASQREAAARCVRGLVGVTGVANQIHVRTQPQALDIQGRIEAALGRRAALEGHKITVRVADGVVRLDGEVEALSERDAAERAARATPGVAAVDDRLVVRG